MNAMNRIEATQQAPPAHTPRRSRACLCLKVTCFAMFLFGGLYQWASRLRPPVENFISEEIRLEGDLLKFKRFPQANSQCIPRMPLDRLVEKMGPIIRRPAFFLDSCCSSEGYVNFYELLAASESEERALGIEEFPQQQLHEKRADYIERVIDYYKDSEIRRSSSFFFELIIAMTPGYARPTFQIASAEEVSLESTALKKNETRTRVVKTARVSKGRFRYD